MTYPLCFVVTVRRKKKLEFLKPSNKKNNPEAWETVACLQTLYFLFKVRRARVIKNKPRGIHWPPGRGGRGEGRRIRKLFIFLSRAPRTPVFFKRTKRKIKQRLCTGYWERQEILWWFHGANYIAILQRRLMQRFPWGTCLSAKEGFVPRWGRGDYFL